MDSALHWLEPVAPHPTSPTQRIELGAGILQLNTPAHDRLTALKNEIDSVSSIAHWDDAKKITNPYEYIFLSLQRRIHRSVAAIVPLSRSYFKMIELWDLIGLDTIPKPMCSAHGAEGPGGFLEAIQDRTACTTRMVAMTLRSTERTVPGWRKSQAFLAEHPHVEISYGADGTGNMYNLPNQAVFADIAHALARPGVDLYTADGGFDFSTDYNGQENTVHRLLAAEALAGLQSLRVGGVMIIKMFDTKNRATLELLWILSNCFMRTALTKPRTSRPANSERYWVGYGLLGPPPAWVTELLATLTSTEAPAGWNTLFAEPPWSPTWAAHIQAFQEEVERHQYDNIQLTLNIIRTPTRAQIYDLLLRNIQNSRAWIAHHRISENRQYVSLRDDQIAALNLEEALAPFQALVSRTSLPTLYPPPPTHRVQIALPPQRPQAGPAWRSELPPSIRGYLPSRTSAGTPSPTVTAPPESHEVPDPAPERP
jgi:hypothetical protein